MRVVDGEDCLIDQYDDHIKEYLRRERIRLCNEWDLVPAEDLRNFNALNESIIADLQSRLNLERGQHARDRKQRHPV